MGYYEARAGVLFIMATAVRVRFRVRVQMTKSKLAAETPLMTRGGELPSECVHLFYPPVVLCLEELELLLDAVQ